MYTLEEWNRQSEKIKDGLNFFNPKHVQFWREYMRDRDVVEPDSKLGRISISRNLLDAIGVNKEVVFFGLSFGWIDYKYFYQFFAKMSTPTVDPISERNKKCITIFTYDESDRSSIFDFLEHMDVDLDYLYSQTQFEIIRTKNNQDSKKVEEFLTRLRNSKPFIPLPKII